MQSVNDNSAIEASHVAAHDRVAELRAIYDSRDASAAWLLCDQWGESAVAYRVISPDLSAEDITYGELRRESERFAAALFELGLRPGDRIATLMGKSREYLVTLLGIWRLGAVHVPLFTAFAPSAIAMRLNGSRARAIVCDEGQRGKLSAEGDVAMPSSLLVISTGQPGQEGYSFAGITEQHEPGFPAATLGPDAPLIQIYTSGTTGDPKGVVVPLRALAAFRTYAEFGLGLRSDDVFWCAADPGWAYGLYFGILATFSTGTPSVLLQGGFVPETTMEILFREQVTNFAAAPTVYRALRSADLVVSGPLRLRCASSAGEPLTPEVNLWARSVLGVTVHDHYGQTEAGMLINNHHHPMLHHDVRPGSMGHAMPGWKAVILDPEKDVELAPGQAGRVAMKVSESPLMWFTGYDGDSAKTAGKFTANGEYYLTGDNGLVDEDGYFRFSAREDDVIIMAGYRIGPFEVEASMSTHPAVAEAAVIAVPDEVRGEVIEAYVVVKDGTVSSPELAKEIQRWVKTHYAAHAYPRAIHFIGALPRTPSGKIQRFMLKQRRLEELGVRA
ncbi:AMP-binding protein [Novosphingobium sp. ST904]|uniref:AMP-binding protein n=1 Tax=Novosphingobium sp. ST904 TaxID=1684385 RepID=UPI0006C864D3|nr:AMP-binding protein [Novosphingobium sp. ST904]KPH66777.1 AMP-dependent synthetase [Novosphingobium sp. ST904]TCM25801.1 acetyl-CoA synthetase [Novosphingobium sp. ST904]